MTVSELCRVIAGLRLSGEGLQAIAFLSLFSMTLAEERLGIVMISLCRKIRPLDPSVEIV